mgnify:FL=1
MIKSAIQLKAKVRNISKGNDKISKAMLRIFFMERFLERVSLSEYKEHFILKGGMLVSSLLGISARATMDIDTTIQALPLNKEEIEKIVAEICDMPLEDNISFKIISIETIMDDFDYPGMRLHMEGSLEKLRQPVKIDISTDDAITPGAVEYKYQLMFEEREISLNTYNIETLLAEKSQTIINRGLANTRMRDFYDMYEIVQKKKFSIEVYKKAFWATCTRRKTEFSENRIRKELDSIATSDDMEMLWDNFKKKNYFVDDIEYKSIIESVTRTIMKTIE